LLQPQFGFPVTGLSYHHTVLQNEQRPEDRCIDRCSCTFIRHSAGAGYNIVQKGIVRCFRKAFQFCLRQPIRKYFIMYHPINSFLLFLLAADQKSCGQGLDYSLDLWAGACFIISAPALYSLAYLYLLLSVYFKFPQ